MQVPLRKKRVGTKLLELLEQLSIVQTELFTITRAGIQTPIQSLTDFVYFCPTVLADSFVPDLQLTEFLAAIKGAVRRLDHIGFCYMVASWEEERTRIMGAVAKTVWNLYEMPSNDLAKWYFIGNAGEWQDPMIELLPALPNDDPDLAYWMPHIHVDINTSFTGGEIAKIIHTVFRKTRKPILYSDPEAGTHCVRLWLGTVSGINVNLDLSTTARNLQWIRTNYLQKIVLD